MNKNIFNFLFTALTIVVSMQSCKKKSKELETQVLQYEAEPQMIYGVFTVSNSYISRNHTFIFDASFSTAVIYDTLVNKDIFDEQNGKDFGSVICNENIYQRFFSTNNQQDHGFYGNGSNSIIKKPCRWTISGNDNRLPFNFADYSNFPTYTTIDELQDTFYINKPNSVQIKNYGGTNQMDFMITSNFMSVSKTLIPPANNVTLSKDEMSNLNHYYPSNGDIYLTFLNKSFRNINGRFYQINNNLIFSKRIVVVK